MSISEEGWLWVSYHFLIKNAYTFSPRKRGSCWLKFPIIPSEITFSPLSTLQPPLPNSLPSRRLYVARKPLCSSGGSTSIRPARLSPNMPSTWELSYPKPRNYYKSKNDHQCINSHGMNECPSHSSGQKYPTTYEILNTWFWHLWWSPIG